MTKTVALGILLAALVQLIGCNAETDEETCRIEFGYTYDAQGHIQELTLDENTDGSVDARVTYKNTYAEAGWINEVETTCVRSDGRTKYKTIHQLNESGRTTFSLYTGEEIDVRKHEYGEFISEEQRNFSYSLEYDPNNRLLSQTLDLNADGIQDEKELYSYDDNGYNEKYEIDEGADGTVDIVTNYTYTFTEQGKRKSVISEEIGLITTITEVTYDYDTEGNLISRSTDVRQDGILDELCTMAYSDTGQTSHCQGYVNGAPIWVRTEQKDTDGRVLISFYEQTDDGSAARNTYTYDEQGNRLTAVYEQRDNRESSWEETEKRTYVHDADGKKLSVTKELLNWGPGTETCADRNLPTASTTVRR